MPVKTWEDIKATVEALRARAPAGGSMRLDGPLRSVPEGFAVGWHCEHVENVDNTKDYFATPESFTSCTYTLYWGDQAAKGVRTDSTTSLSAEGYRARRASEAK